MAQNQDDTTAASGTETSGQDAKPGLLHGIAGPQAMLGLWTSWLKTAGAASGSTNPVWKLGADDLAGAALADGIKQLNDALANDPAIRAIDAMWNANPLRDVVPIDWAGIARALRTVWLRSLSQPDKAIASALELNARLWQSTIDIWTEAGRRWSMGAEDTPDKPAPSSDKRFAAPEWQNNPAYATLRQIYLLASDWLLSEAAKVSQDDKERLRLNFHLRQFVDAVSPSLMLISNPAALRRAMETGGASIADGARNLMQDLKQGRLSMVDATAFAPGRNLALSPGKVVHRNKLIELIQYSPSTDTAHKTPLLILPPWINKFYILDMQPKNSMVRHLVEQGFTVFMVSWKNPDTSMDGTTLEDYMDLGPLEACDVIRDITGSKTVNAMGYCIGGTLLALALAWLAAKGEKRFGSATFMVSMQDFTRVGDTEIFLGEDAIDFVEQQMMQRGYLDSREMSNMFNLLRSNELIWANVVNNYLMGDKPPAFDLLYWNSDGTRMTQAAHKWYLRNTYVENNLMKPGKITFKGEKIDLGNIKQDTYAVGAEKDHIVPWDAAWRITQLFGGPVRFVQASSGHIAGIINPPGGKGTYWAVDAPGSFDTAEQWKAAAQSHDGSWWTDWAAWLHERSGEMAKLPPLGNAAHPAISDAPGTYVLEK